MNCFKSQLTDLIETLQQLPNKDQEAACTLLESSLLAQLKVKNKPEPYKIIQDYGEAGGQAEYCIQEGQHDKGDQEIRRKNNLTNSGCLSVIDNDEKSQQEESLQGKHNIHSNKTQFFQKRNSEKISRFITAPNESFCDFSSSTNNNYIKSIQDENEHAGLSYQSERSILCNKEVDELVENREYETLDKISNTNSLELCTQAVSHLTFSVNISGNRPFKEFYRKGMSNDSCLNGRSMKDNMNLDNRIHIYTKNGRKSVSKILFENKLNMSKRNLSFNDTNEIINGAILESSGLSFDKNLKNTVNINHIQKEQEKSAKTALQPDHVTELNKTHLLTVNSCLVIEKDLNDTHNNPIEKNNFPVNKKSSKIDNSSEKNNRNTIIRSSKVRRDFINKKEIVQGTSRIKDNQNFYTSYGKSIEDYENELERTSPISPFQNVNLSKSLKCLQSSVNLKEVYPTPNSVHESTSTVSIEKKSCISNILTPLPYSESVFPLSEKSNDSSRLCPISCRSCMKILKDASLLSNHQQQCSHQLTCNYCQAKFVHKITYKRHIEGHKRNSCHRCYENFSNQKKLRCHMKQEHNLDMQSKTFSCQFCSRVFLKRSSLYYHLNMHKINSQVVCQKCGNICQNDEEFKKHIEDHIKKTNLSCEICDEFFFRRQQFDDHMKGHQKNKCELCSESYSTKKALIRHYRHLHKSVPKSVSIDKQYKCDKCSKVFNRPSLLYHHLQLHTGVKPLECLLCNKSFSHGRGLRKHKKSALHAQMLLSCNLQKDHSYDVHSQPNQEFICIKCDLKLPNKSRLLNHYNSVHKSSNLWSCQHCSYKTSRRNNLSRHIDLHLKKRKFMCEICGSSFHAMATLKDHYRFVHSDERNFKCSLCKKSFKNKSSLVRHQRIHSDNRPYQCHCGLSYKRQSHLKRHVSSAHNELLESRSVKAIQLSENKEYNSGSSQLSYSDDFEFLPAPVVVTEPNIKEATDVIIPTHESIILMSDSSTTEAGNLITVSDTPIIQFIPPHYQHHHNNGGFQTLPLISTAEFQSSIPLNMGSQFAQGRVVVEPFLGDEATALLMVSPPCVMQANDMSSNSEALEPNTANILGSGTVVAAKTGSSIAIRNTSKQMSKNLILNSFGDREEDPSSPIQNLDYREDPQGVQCLLSSLPSSNYHMHTLNSPTSIHCHSELLQKNLHIN